jgi:hypothetical protein
MTPIVNPDLDKEKNKKNLSCADVPSDDPAHGHNPGTY